jgi:hypothetical protein
LAAEGLKNKKKMKAKVNLGLSKMSILVKIGNARHHVTSMTGNQNFTTPLPSLASITAAANALETAFNNAQGGNSTLTSLMHDKEAVLDNLLSQLANYVEIVANGVDTIILSAGMKVKGKRGVMTSKYFARLSDHPGEIILRAPADTSKRASYLWELSTDRNNWALAGVSTKTTFTVRNLNSGTRYFFRVAAVNKLGQGAFSDPISIVVQE